MSSRREESGPETEWDAYSDYQHVSRRVSKTVVDAAAAIHTIASAERSGEKLPSREETDLRADVMTAVTLVRTELENERDRHETYDEILTRWEGEDGYIRRFRDLNVINPGGEAWLQQFASDIHRAGWELGYLKAGSEKKSSSGGEKEDDGTRELFEEMTV